MTDGFFISMIQAVYTEGENRIDVSLMPNEKKGYDLVDILFYEGDLGTLLDGLKKRGIEGTEAFKPTNIITL